MKSFIYTLAATASVIAGGVQSSPAAPPKRELGDLKKNQALLVYDRSANSYIGTVLRTRHFKGYIGSWRNDPTVVSFAGTEAIKLDNQFSLEAVIHSTDAGKYIWKEGKAIPSPVRLDEEHPLLNRGSQWGLAITDGKIKFYATLDGQLKEVTMAVPKNWNHPVTTHRITGTYDGSTMTLYFDGKAVAKKDASGSPSNAPQAVYAGARADNPGVWAKRVQLDEVRLYARALSSQEVATPLRRDESGSVISADIIQTEKVEFEQ